MFAPKLAGAVLRPLVSTPDPMPAPTRARWPRLFRVPGMLALWMLAALPLGAQSDDDARELPGGRIGSFREAVTRAALEHPEVAEAWHGFQASRAERRVASGNYLPKIDLVAETAREESRTPVRTENTYGIDNSRISLTQMLFDGFATRNEVERLDHVTRARYYDLAQRAQTAGLDATRAYFDVLRRQELMRLAEDNYIEHRSIFRDIEARVQAGVTRRVDLEQANARLALAETNLLIEVANLHDVHARFQRVVGVLPSDTLALPSLPSELIPTHVETALRWAYKRHPRLRAAAAELHAARAEREARFAPMLPRIDLRLSRQRDDDTDGISGTYEQNTAQLVVSYNLFNGGSDSAQRRVSEERVGSARELRENACREVRQEVVIAHNDIQNLATQLEFLDRNQLAIGKARRVYREQFSIGQRSLLDLLDSENEYFEIRRRYVDAKYDLELARARTLSGMGVLLDAIRVRGRAHEARELLGPDRDDPTSILRCPLDIPVPTHLNRQEILRRIERDPRLQRPSLK